MSLKCMKIWLATWALILIGGVPARGQGLEDMQLFAPYDYDGFGGGRHAREGFFFSAEWLKASIGTPEISAIGYDSAAPGDVYTSFFNKHAARNDFNTGFLDANFVSGMRYEFGDISGHHGWFFSGYFLHEQGQGYSPVGGGELIIHDPQDYGTITANVPGGAPGGNLTAGSTYGRTWGLFRHELNDTTTQLKLVPMPVYFRELTMEQSVRHWSIEVNYLFRAHPTHRGGMFEFFGGMRYLEFNDKFGITGRGSPFSGVTTTYPDPTDPDADTVITYAGSPTGPGSIFHDSRWETKADNHIVAPQLGVRWSKTNGRWSLVSEARFFAGFNRQNLGQQGVLGSEIGSENYQSLLDGIAIDSVNNISVDPPLYPWVPMDMSGPLTFNHARYANEWSPGVELRLMANWQATNVIGFQAGYNLIWMDGIARSANMTHYSFGDDVFGINMARNRQDVFINGFTLGVTVNRL